MIKIQTLPILCIGLFLAGCTADPAALLEEARKNISDNAFIAYNYTAYWPNPAGKIDTMSGRSLFLKKKRTYSEYDYVGMRDIQDLVYVDGQFQRIDHQDSLVYIYSAEDLEKEKNFIANNLFILFSPIKYLEHTDWQFAADTVVDDQQLMEYTRVETDTVIEDKIIYVENHILLDPSSSFLKQFERRAFLNGESSQTIVYRYFDYELSPEQVALMYDLPKDYRTQIFGQREKLEMLEVGRQAPNFALQDLAGKTVELEDLRGQKVLLDFSVINCGYCKLALEHLNREDYTVEQGIQGVYINPVDGPTEVQDYVDKIPVPFPVIAGAKEVGRTYGVSGYPTFYLIDEKGIVERVVLGYDKDFLESIKGTRM